MIELHRKINYFSWCIAVHNQFLFLFMGSRSNGGQTVTGVWRSFLTGVGAATSTVKQKTHKTQIILKLHFPCRPLTTTQSKFTVKQRTGTNFQLDNFTFQQLQPHCSASLNFKIQTVRDYILYFKLWSPNHILKYIIQWSAEVKFNTNMCWYVNAFQFWTWTNFLYTIVLSASLASHICVCGQRNHNIMVL